MASTNTAFNQELAAVIGGASMPTDTELVNRVLEGDNAAFELIMRRYNRRLFRLARSILKSEADTEDAVQEAYVKSYAKLNTFRGPDGFSSWISRIVVNEALGRRRRPARVVSLEDHLNNSEHADNSPYLISNDPGPERMTANSEVRTMLEKAVDSLPEDFRTVFVLRDVEGLSVLETAECLSIRPETVKTRLFRARRRLQKILGEQLSPHISSMFEFGGARCDRIVSNVLERLHIQRKD